MVPSTLQLGGLLVRAAGVSLPRPPSWMTSALGEVFAKDPPPKNYSGASLSVQAQQRTDEIEQLMATMYTRQVQRFSRLPPSPIRTWHSKLPVLPPTADGLSGITTGFLCKANALLAISVPIIV